MLKPTIYKALELNDKFHVAFPDKRIPNGVIDKTKTRVGITYTGFHEERHGLYIIPPVATIDDAIMNYPLLNLFPVYNGISTKAIEAYLLSDVTYKKIVSTPEGYKKVINAAKNIGKYKWLVDEVFIYLDEVHCYASDAFREDILTPFDDDSVWEFKNRAFGSATMFKFSDPRFAEEQHYKLTYKEKFGTITIVNDRNPKAALNYMLTHPDMFPGNVFIYFNSVTQSGEAIRMAGITDVNIYCRDEKENMDKLGDCRQYFKPQPKQGEYKKFNFFSRRYDEGWNLVDDETATIILVTDVNKPHSLIGIPFQGFQAIGRLNTTPHKIYHLTNNYGKEGMKDFDTIQQKCIYNAKHQIDYYNQHQASCIADGIEDDGKLAAIVKPFAKFKEGVAELYPTKHDQVIFAEYIKEHYNSLETIEQTWQSTNYNTKRVVFDLLPIVRLKKTREEINKQVIECFKALRDRPELYIYEVASDTLKKYKTEFMLLFEAFELLGEDELIKLNYNNQAMKKALIERSNSNAEAKLRIRLTEIFKINGRYTKKHIKAELQSLYNEFKILTASGSIKTSSATDLEELGMFELTDCKLKDKHGKTENAFLIQKANYCLKQAA